MTVMDLRERASMDTVLVRPYPGLILPDVPATGTHIPRALADSWIANGLVIPIPATGTVVIKVRKI